MQSQLTADDLRQRAMALADQRQGQVINTAIGGMMSLHRAEGGHNYCQCTLCHALRPYVKAKRQLSSLNRMFHHGDVWVEGYVRAAGRQVLRGKEAVTEAWES
jgi:hypothetical protein